ncbi:MAG: hypothetical protein SF172_07120 [Burkholderiales bacterium]|nr:hypothetical protein [Burkholderiales bacterium]
MLCEPRVTSQDELDELHRLLAATLHLMTAYSASLDSGQACPLLAEVISRHLSEISRAADCDHILRATSADLQDRWKQRAGVPPDCPRRPWWLRVVETPAR